MARRTSCSLGFALLLVGGPARAQRSDATEASPQRPPLVELGVSGFARTDFADFCRADGDLFTCTSNRTFIGLVAAPRLRLSRLVSLGALGSMGWSVGSEGTVSSDGSHEDRSLSTWRLEVEGRIHPIARISPDPWLGVDAGVTAYRDTRTFYVNGGRSTGSESESEHALVVGIGAGGDLRVASFLALGAELRGSVFTYGAGVAITAAVGFSGTFLVAP